MFVFCFKNHIHIYQPEWSLNSLTKLWQSNTLAPTLKRFPLAYAYIFKCVYISIYEYRTFTYGDTDYFDIIAGILQGDILAPSYLFIICLDHVLRTSIDKIKENGFKLTNERSRRDPAKNNYIHGIRRWRSAFMLNLRYTYI